MNDKANLVLPSYQDLMLPLLRVLAEQTGDQHQKESTRLVSEMLQLNQAQRESRLPSGGQTFVDNRVRWAGWYMRQAGLVERTRRGHLKITAEGKALLATKPKRVDNKVLAAYPNFLAKLHKVQDTKEIKEVADLLPTEQTPTDQIEDAHQKLVQALASELLELMGKMDPYRFEQLVIDVLFAMGYGGSREEAALVTQKSNDEGIDGIINEDRLGLDVIYVQAKRWNSNVGRADIQSFVGALAGKHATKGIFITTSEFHKSALEYAKGIQQRVILIGGARLAELMVEFGVGVSTSRTISIKRVDSDYFDE